MCFLQSPTKGLGFRPVWSMYQHKYQSAPDQKKTIQSATLTQNKKIKPATWTIRWVPSHEPLHSTGWAWAMSSTWLPQSSSLFTVPDRVWVCDSVTDSATECSSSSSSSFIIHQSISCYNGSFIFHVASTFSAPRNGRFARSLLHGHLRLLHPPPHRRPSPPPPRRNPPRALSLLLRRRHSRRRLRRRRRRRRRLRRRSERVRRRTGAGRRSEKLSGKPFEVRGRELASELQDFVFHAERCFRSRLVPGGP